MVNVRCFVCCHLFPTFGCKWQLCAGACFINLDCWAVDNFSFWSSCWPLMFFHMFKFCFVFPATAVVVRVCCCGCFGVGTLVSSFPYICDYICDVGCWIHLSTICCAFRFPSIIYGLLLLLFGPPRCRFVCFVSCCVVGSSFVSGLHQIVLNVASVLWSLNWVNC